MFTLPMLSYAITAEGDPLLSVSLQLFDAEHDMGVHIMCRYSARSVENVVILPADEDGVPYSLCLMNRHARDACAVVEMDGSLVGSFQVSAGTSAYTTHASSLASHVCFPDTKLNVVVRWTLRARDADECRTMFRGGAASSTVEPPLRRGDAHFRGSFLMDEGLPFGTHDTILTTQSHARPPVVPKSGEPTTNVVFSIVGAPLTIF